MLKNEKKRELTVEEEFEEFFANESEENPIEFALREDYFFDGFDIEGNPIDSSDYEYDQYGSIVGKKVKINKFVPYYEPSDISGPYTFTGKRTDGEDVTVVVTRGVDGLEERINGELVDIGERNTLWGYRWLRVKAKKRYMYGRLPIDSEDDEYESGDILAECLEGCVCEKEQCADCLGNDVNEFLLEEAPHRGKCDRIMSDDSAILCEQLEEQGKEWVHKPTIVGNTDEIKLHRVFNYDYILRNDYGILQWVGQQYKSSPVEGRAERKWCSTGVRLLPLVSKEGEEWLFNTYTCKLLDCADLRNCWYFLFKNKYYSNFYYHDIVVKGQKVSVYPLRECNYGNLRYNGVTYSYFALYDPDDSRYDSCVECTDYYVRQHVYFEDMPNIRVQYCLKYVHNKIFNIMKYKCSFDDIVVLLKDDRYGYVMYMIYLMGYNNNGRIYKIAHEPFKIPCYFPCCGNNVNKARQFIMQKLAYK